MEMDVLERIIKGRRSIRQWEAREVPDEMLLKAIELGTWAPNGGNFQGWRFYVIKNRETIGAIAGAVQRTVDTMASWPEAQQIGANVEPWRQVAGFFRSAPAAIAVCSARYHSLADRLVEARGTSDPLAVKVQQGRSIANSRMQSIGAAIALMLLALHEMGLGAVWMTGPAQAKEEIEALLKISPEYDFVALVPVGYPAEQPSSSRRPVQEVVEFIR